MLVNCKADFLSKKVYHSEKTGKDYYSMVVNGEGGQAELELAADVDIPKYKPLELTIDIIQGKYPHYKVISVK